MRKINQNKVRFAMGTVRSMHEIMSKIELMLELSKDGQVDETTAEEFIHQKVHQLETEWMYLKEYIGEKEKVR